MAQSNLAVRLATGLIGAPLIIALIYLGPPWGWFAFVLAACLVASIELYAMTHAGDRISQAICTVATLGVMNALWFWGGNARVLLTLLIALPFASMFLVLVRLGDMKTAALRVAAGAFGPLYLGGGLTAVTLIRRDFGPDGPGFVVLSLMFAWASDTGAYFAGRFFGRHKLYEAVSPKKTIEGAVGGLLAVVLGTVVAHFWFVKSLPLGEGIGLAVVACSLGQAGDLGESLLKRSVGIKDSGGILPGHGGILDRADALLVTVTITYLYLLWTR